MAPGTEQPLLSGLLLWDTKRRQTSCSELCHGFPRCPWLSLCLSVTPGCGTQHLWELWVIRTHGLSLITQRSGSELLCEYESEQSQGSSLRQLNLKSIGLKMYQGRAYKYRYDHRLEVEQIYILPSLKSPKWAFRPFLYNTAFKIASPRYLLVLTASHTHAYTYTPLALSFSSAGVNPTYLLRSSCNTPSFKGFPQGTNPHLCWNDENFPDPIIHTVVCAPTYSLIILCVYHVYRDYVLFFPPSPHSSLRHFPRWLDSVRYQIDLS